MARVGISALLIGFAVLVGCGGPSAVPGTTVVFDLSADWGTHQGFYRFPYPSDLRLDRSGAPDLAGFPNPEGNSAVEGLRRAAMQRRGFPVVPLALFRFDAPIGPHEPAELIPARRTSPILLIDVDPASPKRGTLYPTVAMTPPPDVYLPENVLTVAPWPGVVLRPSRRYAFVVMRALGDATRKPLGVPAPLVALRTGEVPSGDRGRAARDLYSPLWPALRRAGVAPSEVAAATVFTTADVVADLAKLSDDVLSRYSVDITGLRPALDGADHPFSCRLRGTLRLPQFQKGRPPFDEEGSFQFGAGGRIQEQRMEDVPVVVTVPKVPMPRTGYSLVLYLHGSSGTKSELADGQSIGAGETTAGEGPADVAARYGIAAASGAMPLSRERLPGAGELSYLNFANLAAFRDTFRQGIIETRLLLDALGRLEIDPVVLAGCSGPTLPEGVTSYRFDAKRVAAIGHSTGAMYANMAGALDPRIQAIVPSGGGGFWSLFLSKTSLVAPSLIDALFGTSQLTFLHPVMGLLETAGETVDPIVFVPRLAARPLPEHPARSVYQPVVRGDDDFPTAVFDAMALAGGLEQAGSVVWPSMQRSLMLGGLAGLRDFPVRSNRLSTRGEPYTSVVVQFDVGDTADPHAIALHLPGVKRQYGCFLRTFFQSDTGVVSATDDAGAGCLQPR